VSHFYIFLADTLRAYMEPPLPGGGRETSLPICVEEGQQRGVQNEHRREPPSLARCPGEPARSTTATQSFCSSNFACRPIIALSMVLKTCMACNLMNSHFLDLLLRLFTQQRRQCFLSDQKHWLFFVSNFKALKKFCAVYALWKNVLLYFDLKVYSYVLLEAQ
jgi:hypothetical protein